MAKTHEYTAGLRWEGNLSRVTLVPSVTITEPGREQDALRLHDDAHRLCFIAQSSSVPIDHSPTVRVESP